MENGAAAGRSRRPAARVKHEASAGPAKSMRTPSPPADDKRAPLRADNPYVDTVSKRLRAMRKKLDKIEGIEAAMAQGKVHAGAAHARPQRTNAAHPAASPHRVAHAVPLPPTLRAWHARLLRAWCRR